MLIIDLSLCTGCGTCLDACPTGAISLDESESVAIIDPALCDECLACVAVCPTDAIQQLELPELVPAGGAEIVEGEVVGRQMMLAPDAGPPAMLRPPGRLATLAVTALSFVGSWLLPRAADALVDAVERRLILGEDSVPSTTSIRSGSQASMRRMEGRRAGRPRRRRRRRRGR